MPWQLKLVYIHYSEMDVSDLSIYINQIVSSIQSEDRKKRRNVLEQLLKLLEKLEDDEVNYTKTFETFEYTIVRCLNDQAETVRDLAIDITDKMISKLPRNNKYLEDIIPVLVYRLGEAESRESSEEIRLKLVELLILIIETYNINLENFVEDVIQIIGKTLVDPYPKVRQKSAICCKVMVENIPNQIMYHHGYKLVKPILSNFKQNHFRTRVLAIEALCEVLKEGNWKFLEAQEVFGSLGERLFDATPAVRLAVVENLGTWLLHLRDRYSFFSRLVPLILSCLDDEQPEVRKRAEIVWAAAGNQYATENEQDLKDKMDFLSGKPLHYPDNVERPNIGCRTLVQRNTIQTMTPLIRELDDWKIETRIKGSFLLVRVILHGEEEITQHSEYILQAMYKLAEKDDTPVLVENVEKGAEYLGYFILTETWYNLIYPVLEDGVRLGHLRILSALCRGTKQDDLQLFSEALAKVFCDRSVCTMREPLYQTQLLKCCYALIKNLSEIDKTTLQYLYLTVVYVSAISMQNASVFDAGQGVLEELATKTGTTIESLAENHIKIVLQCLRETVEDWTAVHSDVALFTYTLKQPIIIWWSAISEVIEILKISLKVDRDASMRNQLFIQLTDILTDSNSKSSCGADAYKMFLSSVLQDMVCTNLVWRAGRTSEALRTTVVICLHHVLEYDDPWEVMPLEEIMKSLLPPLVDCLRDAAPNTRLFGLKCLSRLVIISEKQGFISTDHVNFIYTEVLNRLDDVCNDVRFSAVETLATIYGHLPKKYTEQNFRYHFETLIQTMLTHLDDKDEIFQKHMLEALKIIGENAPEAMTEKVSTRKHLFKAQHLCQELLQHIQNLSPSTSSK